MWASDLWAQRCQIDGDLAAVFGVGVCFISDHFAVKTLCQISTADIVDWEDAILRAAFDGHVGDGESAVHGKMRQAVAAEFQALIKCAVDADHADKIEDDVLAGHVFVRWRAGNGDLDRFRHLQPGFTADHCSSDVGAAHAGGKCAHCAIGAGVAVGADDELTSANDALFRQEAMLNAHLADFIIMLDLVGFREIADGFALLRALDVLRR